MKREYIEKIYAGWLSKIIGIRYGAPIEGWEYDRIRGIYGDSMKDYPAQYKTFAADDDSNGPWFFLRAMEDADGEPKAADVAQALLNYAPFEHGFFWWGGYGVSTEHTAYLNLRHGILAPRSGSMAQNGTAMAEQIGGQIFSDTWGLVSPGNPERAARMARTAASVTHDGDGLNGAAFVAACVSAAFEESDIRAIVETGLHYAGADTGYGRMVRAVMDYYDRNAEEGDEEGWRKCFAYIRANYGYDRYPGACHIIPNVAVMVLAMMYGEGDYSRTLEICNLCGWDTDCNVGNVAAILGVALGLSAIDERWRRPVGDLLISSSVVGAFNILDIPQSAAYIAAMAYKLDGQETPAEWKRKLTDVRLCHFEFPGSTHAMKLRAEDGCGRSRDTVLLMENVEEAREGGGRSLRVLAPGLGAGEMVRLYKQTYFQPEDFSDSRYDPAFSPVIYPGQVLEGAVMLPWRPELPQVQAALYVKDIRSGAYVESEPMILRQGTWETLRFRIPGGGAMLLGEAGICFKMGGRALESFDLEAYVDEFTWGGEPDYALDLSRETEEVWPGGLHREISQFTRLKGNAFLQDGSLHLSCADFGEMYTGGQDWADYEAEFEIVPVCGGFHGVNVRVQGAVRSYGAALLVDTDHGRPVQKLAIVRSRTNGSGYEVLAAEECGFEYGVAARIRVRAKGTRLEAEACGVNVVFDDEEAFSSRGCVGISVRDGSHLQLKSIRVRPAV